VLGTPLKQNLSLLPEYDAARVNPSLGAYRDDLGFEKGGIVMGLLDGIVGYVLGSMLSNNQTQNPFGRGGNQAQGGNLLLQIALSMLQQNGGLEGVLNKFRQGGLAQQADSWVGTGQNMNISADQLQQVFGSSTISDLASRLGMPADQAGSAMAQMLPDVINQLTPQGQVPENSNDEISQGLSALANSELLK
jgi:uncharacterized protein YidB (DUF937 family)